MSTVASSPLRISLRISVVPTFSSEPLRDPEPVGIYGHWVSIVIKTTTPALRPQAFSLPPAAHSAYFVPWQGGRVYPQPCSQPL